MGQPETIRVTNGVRIDELNETINALRENPSLAVSRFYAHNRWRSGCQNRTALSHFYSAGEDHAHPEVFELDADEPPALGGDESAPNPVEHLLNALASCLTTSLVAHATVRGIHIEEVESELEGDIDLRGFLGLESSVPKGYTDIRVRFRVKTDEQNMEKLRRLALFSPVFNTLTRGVDVDVVVEKA